MKAASLRTPALRALALLLAVASALLLLPHTPAEAAGGGWEYSGGDWYYLDPDGTQRTGWARVGNAWYYLDPDTGKMQTGLTRIENDGTYYLRPSGAMLTGWLWMNNAWYYFGASGRMATGWARVGSTWYYLDPATGKMQTGLTRIENDGTYYLRPSGAMLTGWLWMDNAWYYFGASGRMATGWARVGSAWYYLDPATGKMQTGWIDLGGAKYYLTASGAMATGWRQMDNAWYYFDASGRMATGWARVGSAWYYLDPATGKMQTGWIDLGGAKYYLTASGAMATGWRQMNNAWYYFDASGRMATGWAEIDNDTYYFYTDGDPNGGPCGAMAAGTTIDGTVIKAGGAAVTQKELNMIAAAQRCTSPTSYLLLVDTAGCKTGVFRRSGSSWELVYYWNCAPGAPSTPTVKGTFSVQAKGYYFDSGNARCFYYTQFYGNYLFHTVLCYRDGSVMDGRVGMQLSHGCVRLPISQAKWIYDNIPARTTVYIY